MAHELEIRNGEASMFYVRDAPWHGLGQKLDGPATAAEAIKAARMDWTVRKIPLHASDGKIELTLPDKYAVVRADLWGQPGCRALGIVGRDYRPLQNRDAFAFFDPIVGQSAAIYHTAGVLGDGERVWILAKLPKEIRVVGDDIAEKYLLLSNSHDGQSSVQMKFTPIRVVCQNTLTMALSQGPTVRAAHMPNLEQRLQVARRLLGLIENRFEKIGDAFREMVKVQMNGGRLAEYLGLVFPDPKDPENEKAVARVNQDRAWATYFFDQGKGNRVAGVQGTLWAAYNGVAELVDHRQTTQNDEWRLRAVWFGTGYSVKARAFSVATAKKAAWQN